ncbi:hypothetical protein ACPPVV_18760 [Rhodanobacter sp. Col0626]|uniref:hypothetical protein n=1 Tax=Rhodanobacter sp. Col0626 TaxID=3415679 RepID=UPI003CE83139
MKIAVIFVGSHFVGKSRTINRFLKPLLGISSKARLFTLDGKDGCVLSQSFEESGRDAKERIQAYAHLDLLAFAARPASENASKLALVESILHKNGFSVHHVQVTKGDDNHYESLAKNAFKLLRAKV